MIIRSRLKEKGIDAAIILLLFLLMGIYSCSEKSLRPVTFAGSETGLKIKSCGPRAEDSISFLNRYAR